MDIGSLIGIIGGVFIIVFGIISGKQGLPALLNFGDLPSVIITLGGTFVGLMSSYKMPDFVGSLKTIGLIFGSLSINESDTIRKIIELSNTARKEGLLQLEEASASLEDQFMKKGVLLIVDGTDPELLRAIMETELVCVESRHKKVIGFWEDMSAMGPAWGMIGTLIGLVNMLKNMADASSIGPDMSVALLTTLYGSVLANWLATPVANKLKRNNELEITLREMTIEGLLSIQAGENPRVIEEKLKSFLSPKQREAFGSAEEDGGENQ